MSDDTPTAKFDPTGDAPTERLDAAGAEAPVEAVEQRKSRRLTVILGIVGGVLLLGVIILLVLLLTRGGGAPVVPTARPTATATPTTTPSPTPTATEMPSPTPTQTVAPPPPVDPIRSFTVDDDSVDCEGVSSVPMQFVWETSGVTLWFGVGTDNAKNAPYDTFPLVYTLDFDYQCGQADGQQKYTITVEQSNGDLQSKTIVVKE
ncbi:hypothetical protein PYV02_06530 [Leifsonia sp. H3M29-4]|uniref:hypothetical protein n=1 Tax=Salinibacterium metalliresistens TaxID=3031321 RepID=UPI0023DA91EE|nr:hypothetical protein [Salinibacterium metalliresistens]MDF1478739.1 hypothetical protein [Salinibacterium metalliresistens]